MSSHGPHPSILEHGLADGCERCAEIACDPFAGLDDTNLILLVNRTRGSMAFPRTDTEAIAMRNIATTLVRVRQLQRIGAA